MKFRKETVETKKKRDHLIKANDPVYNLFKLNSQALKPEILLFNFDAENEY